MTGYDIIGDVHGSAAKLEGLLVSLGYREFRGVYAHQDRQAIFVGDLVDRGPQQLRTIEIVRAMLEDGTAQIVMGNHEFNAISYAIESPSHPGHYLRDHTSKNFEQHSAFLEAVTFNSTRHREILSWFMTFPLWLDLDGLRIIHACWHQDSIDALSRRLRGNVISDSEFIYAANTKGTMEYATVDTILKGPEVSLTDHKALPYRDKEGYLRGSARLRWWDSKAKSLRSAIHIPPRSTTKGGKPYPKLPKAPCKEIKQYRYPDDAKEPVFFGHYWNDGTPKISQSRAICVDYGAVLTGKSLYAYRFTPGEQFDVDNFVGFPFPGK